MSPHSSIGRPTREPDPKPTIKPDKHKIQQDPDQATAPTEMANSATFARSRATDRKTAGKKSKKLNPAKTGKDEPFGLKCM